MCGACNEVNDTNVQYCVNCGHSLFNPCPNCGKSVASNSKVCPDCGFPTGNRHLVERYAEQIEKYLLAGEWANAKNLLAETLPLWRPQHADKLLSDLQRFQDAILVAETEEKAARERQAIEEREAQERLELARIAAARAEQEAAMQLERERLAAEQERIAAEREQRDFAIRLEQARVEAEAKAERERKEDEEREVREKREAEERLAREQLATEQERIAAEREQRDFAVRLEQARIAALAQAEQEAQARQAQERQAYEENQRLLVAHLHQLLNQQKFFTARRFLFTRDASIIPEYSTQQSLVNSRIVQVETLMQRAFSDTVDRNTRIDLCRQALVLCSDYKEALELLRQLPPFAPLHLRAQVRDQQVSLNWEASSTTIVTYRIIRKTFSPTTPNSEGTLVADAVSGLTYVDTQPDQGVPICYTVFACHEYLSSEQGAEHSPPVIVIDDVSSVNVTSVQKTVHLTWKSPTNAHSIVIVRKEGKAPTSSDDGLVIQSCDTSSESYVDTNVEYDRTYYYLFLARYKHYSGQLVFSQGRYKDIILDAPPLPLKSIELQSVEEPNAASVKIVISWQQPKQGEVIILKSSLSLSAYADQVLTMPEIIDLSTRLTPAPNTHQVVDYVHISGVFFYTPIVVVQQKVLMGASQRYVFVADVQDLRHQNLGNVLRLQWIWPENCQEVQVSYSTLDWPKASDTDVTLYNVSRSEYERCGYFDMHGALNALHYIIVTALLTQEKLYQTSRGVRVNAYLSRILVVSYEIRQPGLFRKLATLSLKARITGSLPAMVLIWQSNRLPVSRKDGQLLQRIDPLHIDEHGCSIELLHAPSLPENAVIRLFLEDDSLCNGAHLPSSRR